MFVNTLGEHDTHIYIYTCLNLEDQIFKMFQMTMKSGYIKN